MRLTLIRHAESTWNATGRWQGQSDVPLSPRGHLQARSLAQRFFERGFAHRITSDLSRTVSTASALGEHATPDRRFREIDVGAWAGLKRAEVKQKFGDEVAKLRSGQPVRIGGGESMEEFEGRVDAAIDDLRAKHRGEEVLLVTHGGVVRALVQRICGVRGRASPFVGVGNTAISVVREEGGQLGIEVYNDGVHLAADDQDSALHIVRGPLTRLALIAARPDEDVSQAQVDGLLGGLGIPQYYSFFEAREAPLAEQLLADPRDSLDLDALRQNHQDGSFALVLPPDRIPPLVAHLLTLSEREAFVAPSTGQVCQLRLADDSAELFSYGITCEL